MDLFSELNKISAITSQIYLSGIYPLMDNPEIVKKLGITAILSCVGKEFVADIHERVMLHAPNVTILYLPYYDTLHQNLRKTNQGHVEMVSYCNNSQQYQDLQKQLKNYDGRPLLGIGYHFLDKHLSAGEKVLIHCIAGVSRSVSVLIHYLMQKYNMPFDQALHMIQRKRSIANPNASFRKQLIEKKV